MNYWDTSIVNKLKGLDLKKFRKKKQIINQIYRTGEISSTQIGKMLNISVPTTLVYLNELIAEGFIEERGKGDSIGGRKPGMFGLKKNSVYIVAVEITKHSINTTIFNNELESIMEPRMTSSELINETSTDLILEEINKTISASQINSDKIIGIGITMPGLVNSELGINYSYLKNNPIGSYIHEKLNLPVLIENDARARTLAEFRYGAAKDHRNVLYLQIDWGLGTGMIFNGKIYRGNSGFAGEFSHIPIDPNGKPCACGKKGCLETLVSGDALVEDAIIGLENHIGSAIYSFCKTEQEQLTPRKIIEFAQNGDQYSLSLINNLGEALGKGISYLIQILNPEIILLGGRVAAAGEYLETTIQQSLYKYCMPKLREDVSIIQSGLRDNAGILGAALIIMEYLLDDELLNN